MKKFSLLILIFIQILINFKIFANNTPYSFEGNIWKIKKCTNYSDNILSGKFNYDFTKPVNIITFIDYYDSMECLNKFGNPSYQANGKYEVINVYDENGFEIHELLIKFEHLHHNIRLNIIIKDKIMKVCNPKSLKCKEFEKT